LKNSIVSVVTLPKVVQKYRNELKIVYLNTNVFKFFKNQDLNKFISKQTKNGNERTRYHPVYYNIIIYAAAMLLLIRAPSTILNSLESYHRRRHFIMIK